MLFPTSYPAVFFLSAVKKNKNNIIKSELQNIDSIIDQAHHSYLCNCWSVKRGICYRKGNVT